MSPGRGATADPLLTTGAALLCSLLLGGCSGTALGERLAASFSAAPQPTTATPGSPRSSQNQTQIQPSERAQPQPSRPINLPGQAQGQAKASVALAPAPYRITIKLPSGDPSAPAEVVTQALRAAGVAFEVETIERVVATTPAAAAQTDAPARPTPAPQPR